MTIRNIISVVVGAFLLVVLASCGSSRNYPERRDYPGYPYPDGRSYPTSRYPAPLPPGHAKKVYRYKSAKVFAPGQRNKHYDDRYYDQKVKAKKYKKSKGRH